ncbi:helix-turn-helix domain-containing protein [Kribbella sp. NPDC050124]|uniref:helix-turn-helix domain-containing protein n=1 Tax=Kribbella sp. NPDC050124 TaxID=3364114 RepID=UPI0037A4241E
MTASVSSRLLAVLRTFSHRTPLQTLSEISRRSGLPLTTTHRLVHELLQGGALEREDDGRYRIGLWLWELAALAPRGLGLREVALGAPSATGLPKSVRRTSSTWQPN